MPTNGDSQSHQESLDHNIQINSKFELQLAGNVGVNTCFGEPVPETIQHLLKAGRRKPMAQTLEAIRSNGGSIKLGTTGTIGVLMSIELESLKHKTQTRMFDRTLSTPRGFKSKTKAFSKHATPEIAKKTKHHSRQSHVPILDSDNISIDGTPIRQKSDRRISYIVEVVDVTCGSRDKAWANPVTNRLKKLGFSKLS